MKCTELFFHLHFFFSPKHKNALALKVKENVMYMRGILNRVFIVMKS